MVRAVVFPQLTPPPSVFVAVKNAVGRGAPRPVERRCAVHVGIGSRQHDLAGLADLEPDGHGHVREVPWIGLGDEDLDVVIVEVRPPVQHRGLGRVERPERLRRGLVEVGHGLRPDLPQAPQSETGGQLLDPRRGPRTGRGSRRIGRWARRHDVVDRPWRRSVRRGRRRARRGRGPERGGRRGGGDEGGDAGAGSGHDRPFGASHGGREGRPGTLQVAGSAGDRDDGTNP